MPGRTQQNSDKPPAYEPGESLKEVHDPVVAIVDGRNLHLSELGDLTRELPLGERAIPFETLYPALLKALIDHTALELKARRLHLDEDPVVMRRMRAAAGRALEQALLEQIQGEKVTENAIGKLYGSIYAGKTTVDQVHIRVILLGSARDADTALARVQVGEDFATVARDMSRDPSSVQGGDLGLLRREQLRPEIADVVFSLGPRETTPRPVRSPIGWYIIKLEERVSVPPPSFEAAQDELRRLLTQQTINAAAASARAEALVKQFNMDGSPAVVQGGKSTP